MNKLIRIPYEDMILEFSRVLEKYLEGEEKRSLCAKLFANASRDGVASHGLNRFPLFIDYIEQGFIKPEHEPRLIQQMGNILRWDGQFGIGNLNAWHCMQHTLQVAKEQAWAMSTLSYTNHWMRGGNFGWQAVDQGCIGICWTNTIPNMAAWGGKKAVIGNNPLIVGLPHPKTPMVWDAAMSQYSFGKLNTHKIRQTPLPMPGGWNQKGELTTDAQAILEGGIVLPIGFWKGAGLSLILDILASGLSGGENSRKVGDRKNEYGVSQVFIAIDPTKLGLSDSWQNNMTDSLNFYLADSLEAPGNNIRYPGQHTLKIRAENMELGVPVDSFYWEKVLSL
ncbi:MAG: 3-dehydro-L-gulonate 2-dehydrogenase [Bacteroidota bacterium]